MDKIDLLKAIREWKSEHKDTNHWARASLEEALATAKMLEDIGLICIVNGQVCSVEASHLYEALEKIRAEGTRCLLDETQQPIRAIYNIDEVDRIARQAIAKYEDEVLP